MPAALGIEFFHNFTLIHDDIQDGSTTRHGHPTVWTRWGVPQAINAGDTLLSIAQQALLGLDATCGSVVAVRAAQELNQVCLRLTRGQYLDMAFEKEEEVELETYLDMIRDKTAELLAFSTGVGGLAAGAGDTVIRQLSVYGENLGMAFQVQDDLLGIWGDPAVTGKSAAGDLLARKKTLPILFGLRESEAFRALWRVENPEPEQVTAMADLLQACGAQAYVRAEAAEFTRQAFDALAELFSGGNADADALKALTEGLLHRQM
jgi:geranylgeranyl diphosphate synthase type I